MKINLINCLSVLLFIGFCYLTVHSQSRVGYVYDVQGDWQLNGGGTLRKRQPLPASGKISTNPRGESSSIKISDRNGRIRIQKTCSKPCSFRLPAAPAQTSYIGAFFSTVMDLIWSSPPERYSAHRSKGRDLSDNVGKLENGKIYLMGTKGLPEEIFVKWRKVSNNNEYGVWSEPSKIKNENGQIEIASADFSSGLYEFCTAFDDRTMQRMKTDICSTNSAWIFAASPDKYEQINQEFIKTKAAIFELTKPVVETENGKEKEISGIDSDTAKVYLRAYLDSLMQKENVSEIDECKK